MHKRMKALFLLFLVGLLVLVCIAAGPFLAYASSGGEYDYVDNNVSNMDSSSDKGTHSNFTAQQFGPDDTYDTLTEGGSIADFRVKQGTFIKTTTTGTQTVSSVGFQPKAVIFWWTRQTSYGELAAVRVGYGIATYYGGAYQNRGVAFASDDAVGSSDAGRRRSETYSIIILNDGAPTLGSQASVTAFNSDGFVLNWTTSEASADVIHFIALGGSDLTNAKAGTFSLTTATGTQDITDVGFQPDFLMFLWTFTEAVDTNTAHAEIGIGFAVSSTKRGALVVNSEDGRATMDTWRQQRTDACILVLTPTSGAQDAVVDFSQFLSNGFQITKSDAPAAATPIFYMALDGGQYDVGNFDSPTTTGDQDVTGIPFQPQLVMLATQGRSAGTAIGSHAELAFGAAMSSTQRGCTWVEDPDGLADSDNEQETLDTKIIQWRDRTATNTFTLRGSADFNSFLSDGFRLSWSSVETAGRQVIYAAFGGSVNYELDLEVQWTNATYTRTNEELCIKTGATGAEDIKVYVWNVTGSSWHLVFSDLTANSWNNISVTSYLTSSTFTVRFLGGTETGDTTQDAWQIDCTLLHTWGAPPVANFSFSPEYPYQGDTVTFNASASYDPDGVIVSYFWDFGDGTNATGEIATHVYADDGIYTVTLTVTDNDGLSDIASVGITVLNRAPVASFIESAETVYTGEAITFNASDGYDPDGTIVSYFWNFGDGTNATGVIVGHSYADDGIYTVILTVTDDDGATASASATKTILNRPPVAIFTESATTVRTGEVIYFDASGSYDPDGGIVSYFWDFGDGTNASGVVIDHSYIDDGAYTVTLMVTDDDGATASTTATKTVLNRPPVTSFTESAETVYTSETISFNASTSYDSDGSIISYFWNFGDGTNATGAFVEHAYVADGVYNVSLTVTDNDGATATTFATKTVLNRPPVASFTESSETLLTGETFTFNASASYDLDGSIVSYFWDFGDGTNATGVVVDHTYWDNGYYSVILTVTDDDGATDTESATKTVLNRLPVASFTESAEIVYTGEVVHFDAFPSYDQDGAIVSYFWDFGDGSNASGVTVDHAYADDGNYTVTLTVTDDDGGVDTDTATKTVLNRSPVASFTESAEVVYTGETIYFNGSGSSDSDGSIVSYFWDFGDGTNATGIIVEHSYVDDGNYTVTLTVTDDDGATANATATKTVLNRSPVPVFTESAEIVYINETIYFNASGSYDPDGSIVSYWWDFGDGVNATGVTTEHSYSQKGNYTVTLTVTDDDGATNSTSAIKSVLNRPPVAVFTESAETVLVGETIYFNASASYDPDGYIVSYFWDFGDGTNATGVTTEHAYVDNGVYTVKLTITDNDGATASIAATKNVEVTPPVAIFTESAETVYTGEVIYFNASGSYDPDGVVVSYFWDFGDGSNATSVTVGHAYADDGNYTVTLTVTDDDGVTDTATSTKTVLNRSPEAVFTESATVVYTDEVIYFDASGSYDPDGSIVGYFWDFGDGTNATGVLIDHSYVDDGNYTVTLTVTDDDGATASASAVKTVLNRPPVAIFAESAETVYTGEVIYFNASGSYDPDGVVVSYFWDFGDGSNATSVIVEHTYLEDGNYTVTLTVTDDDGASSSSSATKTVLNRPPTASFTESAETVYTGEVITFNASASYDSDGTILSYFWDFGDGINATGAIVEHSYTDDGNYTVTLTVRDNDGATGTATSTKTVLNRPPVASFTESATTVLTGEAITFNASSSYDPDGYIISYKWDFGDGNITIVTGSVITHAYADNGAYTVTLTVTDNDGGIGSSSAVKTVLNRPPVASFVEDKHTVYTGEAIQFNASASYDPDGFIVSYRWDFGDGNTTTTTNPFITHAYLDNGTYTVTLTVTDNDGATATASDVKTVLNRPPVASFTESAETVYTGEVISFNASASYDPDGTIVNYFWTFGDGTNATGVTVTHAYVDEGTYLVTLAVTDNDGAQTSTTAIKTVLNRSPVASFTESATTVLTNEVIYFNASASYDPDGFIVSYFWTFGDGTNATGITVSHAYVNNGNYTVTLTVKDDDNATASMSATKTVLNRAPVATFTESATTVLTGEVIYFNASGSYDPDGTIVSYFWTFGDGTNASGVNVSHAYADNGMYTVTLTVKDDDGATASASATKTVLNRPPVAIFTESATTVYTGEIITFNASASYDPDGSIVSYFWTFGDGTNTTGVTVTHSYTDNGTYIVTLTVTDNDGATASSSSTKTVLNRPPIASFTESASTVYTGEIITFNASASYDPDGSIVSYFWTFGDGTNSTGKIVNHAYTDNGVYTVTLTVTDNDGATATASAIKTVKNRPPIALFTESAETAYTTEVIYFNASASYDPDGSIISYFWDFGDGTNATGVTTSHAYAENGVYTVTLTVTDNDGAKSTTSSTKTILNRPPVASFTESATTVLTNEVIYFNASGSYDPDGSIVNYFWTFGDGTNATGITVSHAYVDNGTYVVTLTVTDNDGSTESTTATKTVLNRPPVASFTESASIVLTGEVIYFDSSASNDPDGSIISYFWNFGDGTNATGVITEHAYANGGVYNVTLTVTDNDGATASAVATKFVGNRPPTAIFTESAETVYSGEVITFNASSSYDSDGSIVSYFWNFGDGTNSTGVSVEHSYSDEGSYTVTLTVTDDDGATTSTSATKTVLNRPPLASFVYSPGLPRANEMVTFNASDSYDPDGKIVSYIWDFGDGNITTITKPTITHVYSAAGNYTVTLTVTDDDGLTDTIIDTITIRESIPMAVFTYSPDFPIVNETVTFNASGSYDPNGYITSYDWDFGDGNTTTVTDPIITHVYSSTGNYTVTLTVTDNDGLTDTTTDVVRVRQYPTASFTYSPTSPYMGDTVTFNASSSVANGGVIISYLWNFGNGSQSVNETDPITTHVYDAAENYTVTLTVTDSEGLSDSVTEIVTVGQAPVAVFTYSPDFPIVNETVTFNASGSYDPNGYVVSYVWKFGDGNITTVSTPIITHVYTKQGSYKVVLTVVDDDGYTDTLTATIKVRDYPTASFTYSPDSPIVGEVVTFNASSSLPNGGEITSYSWNFGDGNTTTIADPIITHIYLAYGSYTVTLTVTDSEGLSDSESTTLSIRDYPEAAFTFTPSAPNKNDTVTFNASSSIPNGGVITSYWWDFGDGTPPVDKTSPTTTHTYTSVGNYTVTLTVADSEGLTDTAYGTITVGKIPVAAFTYTPGYPIANEAVTFNASDSYDLDGNIVSYGWDFGDGNTTTVTTPTLAHIYTKEGNYTINLTVTDNDGLTDTTTQTVSVRNYPTAAFTHSPDYPIAGETATFNATSSSPNGGTITSYQWNFGDGNVTTVSNPIIIHIYSAGGNYTVTLTVTDSEGLSDSLTKIVVVKQYPVASFTYSPAAPYVGDVVTLNASQSYDPNGYVTSYLWDFGDGTPTINKTNPITTHIYTISGNYTVMLRVTDNEGLNNTTTRVVNVRKAPIAVFTHTPDFPIAGETVTFNASNSFDPNGYIANYTWNFGDGNVTTVTTPITTHTYSKEGNYTVTLTVTDNDGYTDTTSDIVAVRNYPTAAFTCSPSYPIAGKIVIFDASSSSPNGGVITSYSWNFGDGTNATGVVVDHVYATIGNYTVTLTVIDSEGLGDLESKTVRVRQYPTAAFTYWPSVPYVGDALTFDASSSTPNGGEIISYSWNFSDGNIVTMTTPIVTHVYSVKGNYVVTLTVKDSEELNHTISKVVKIGQSPIALFTYTPVHPVEDEYVTFNASESYDLNGYVVSYRWSFGDGGVKTVDTPTVTYLYGTSGTYNVTLTITDNDGFVGTTMLTVKVRLPGYPVARFTYSPGFPTVGESITFNASDSYDPTPGGSVVSYYWRFGDGQSTLVFKPVVAYSYASTGDFNVTLEVTDKDGNKDTVSKRVAVSLHPHAEFTWSPQIAQVYETVTFNASTSIPRGGVITSYQWNFGDGNINTTTTPTVTHVYLMRRDYAVTLKVTDSEGLSDTIINVITIGTLPVATFTYSPDYPLSGEVVTFNASGSYDPDGSVNSYRWNFGDHNISLTTNAVITHTYMTTGNYTVTLTVMDNDGLAKTTTQTVRIGDFPTAAFTYSPFYPLADEPVTFNASSSSPNGGVIVSYSWDFGDGNTTVVTSPMITHVYSAYGNYTVTLTVTDSEGLSDSASTTLSVRDYPEAVFTFSPTAPYVGDTVNFNASSSTPNGGTITSYLWNFGDGSPPIDKMDPVTTHIYKTAGNYSVLLTVTDSEGLSNKTTRVIIVYKAPIASFTYLPDFPIVNATVTFDASDSYDPNGYIANYTWDFCDGNITTLTDSIVTHVYSVERNYTVVLTVTDNEGYAATLTKTVRVRNYPTAAFTYSPEQPFVDASATFDASSSSPNGGVIVSYEWDFGDGNITTATDPIIYHIYRMVGNYTVALNVTDSEGLWSITSMTISILPLGPTADFTWSPLSPLVNQTITFNASSSTAGWNGTHLHPIVSYKWDFGDGNTTIVTYPIINHTYTAMGNYNVTLTVTDSSGLEDECMQILNVKTALEGDLNGDCKVDMKDIAIVAKAFGSYPGDSNWNPIADINGDGKVDMYDVAYVASRFGTACETT